MQRFFELDETASTNTWLAQHPELKPFTSVRAILQTAGRGRLSRQWISGRAGQNLAFSVLLPVAPHDRALVPARVGLSIRRALLPWVNLHLKWPNDLIANGRKLGGILCEQPVAASNLVIAGIGLNILDLDFAPAVDREITSLAAVASQPVPAVRSLWVQLARALQREFRRSVPFNEIVTEYNSCAVRYQRRAEFPGAELEFATLLPDGRAEMLLDGGRIILSEAS